MVIIWPLHLIKRKKYCQVEVYKDFYVFVFTWCLPHWVFIRTVEITPDAPLPWAEQSQLAQPLLIGGMLQTLHHCLGPTLDSFQMSLQGED